MNPLNPVILCVDDEEANLKLLEKLLVPRGYIIVRAASGKDALLKIKSQAIDLVLLDIVMPGMNGFEVCRQIKEDQKLRNIPVIIITASSVKKDRILGIEAGAEDFLSKPLDLAEVLARTKMLLKLKRLDDDRKLAESQKEDALAALHKSHDELERRVRERTAELTQANEALKADITERKLAEEALQASENKFRDLVEKSIVGIYLMQDDAYRYVNKRFAEIQGYTIEEMVDKMGISETVLPEDMPKVDGNIQKRLAGEIESSRYEFRIITKQREIRTVEVYGTYTMYQGKPAVIGTLVDITEQKRDEERLMDFFSDLEKKNVELENAYDELRESQQKIIQQEKMASIGQLAAGIVHEINNPVAFVMSNLHSMDKYSERLAQFITIQSEAVEKLSEQDRDIAVVLDGLHKERQTLKIDYVTSDLTNAIKESLEGAERVKRIVQDLMGFSRKDESVHKLADINDGMESTINVVWNELKYKADVKKEYGQIPLTKCNIGQLNQVFMNLMINAVHAIEEHGEILIRTEHRDGDIAVSVSDTGCGIPEDKLNIIFEPFFTTKEVGKGTGLGLSIAYDIVKRHNGEILVTSEIGKGTTFTVKIPVVED